LKTAKDYYLLQGFTQYMAIDVNERMDAVVADLNYPLDIPGTFGQFDLVTDNGTGEHLFDQYAVWSNHHRLTKHGGVMLKVMPFTPWFNHGFYNFNPILFRDVALANGYKWMFLWICDRVHTPVDIPTDEGSWAFVEKRPKGLIQYLAGVQWSTDMYIVAAWQKVVDTKNFQMPLQGKYKKDVTDDKLRQRYD
jgi:SAM-dependent methyltransferase